MGAFGRIRPFRGLGDIKRALERAFGRTMPDSEALDAVTVAGALGMGLSFPGAFSGLTAYPPSGNTFRWSWWKYPAGAYKVVTTPEFVPKFWAPGPPVQTTPQAGQQADDFANGWMFVPEYFHLFFFDATLAAKSGQASFLYASSVADNVGNAASEDKNWCILGRRASGTNRPVQSFSPYTGQNTGRDCDVLFPLPLLPGTSVEVEGISGLGSGDYVRTVMVGRWKFEPRLNSQSEEPNR